MEITKRMDLRISESNLNNNKYLPAMNIKKLRNSRTCKDASAILNKELVLLNKIKNLEGKILNNNLKKECW